MEPYKQLYFMLFNRITDAINALNNADPASAKRILIAAHQNAEDLYISAVGTTPELSHTLPDG